MPWAILDTNVYIGNWEDGRYEKELGEIRLSYLVRHSAVVLSELRRGARTRQAKRLVEELQRNAARRWEPTADDWWEAGRIVQEIGDAEDWEASKRRDFQNDALIALTARRHGSAVVTANRADFARLARRLPIEVIAF